ncbi:MAG: tRNA dihydrouridine synthase DusB [Terriglobales bacterium]
MGMMQKYWYKSEPGAEAPRDNAESDVPGCGSLGSVYAGAGPFGSHSRQVRATETLSRAFPSCLRIGGVEIRPATVLAPMAGVTDTVFRRFIKNLGGCGLIMTEFTSADGVLRNKKVRGKYLHFYEDEHPISAQLFGSNPEVLADAARLVEDLGFDLVDLNLGCPAKKVVRCNGGSGLLRDLPLIRTIFESVRAAVKIPFTVKFRAGWNDEEIVCVELARMAEDCGLGAVALHARTREQGYSGNARWEWIASVKQAVKIPVIGNGDIRSPEDACAMVAQTGCDAVMIGRSAPANPWIFRQIEQYVSNQPSAISRQLSAVAFNQDADREGHDFSRAVIAAEPLAALAAEGPSAKLYDEPTEADRYQMIRTYFQMLLEEEIHGTEGKMKQFASWFTHGIPGGAALRKAIYDSKTGSQILSSVEQFFEPRLAVR